MRAWHVSVHGGRLLYPCITPDIARVVRGGWRSRAVSRARMLIWLRLLCERQCVCGGRRRRPEARERAAHGALVASVVLAGRMQPGM